MGYNGDMGRTVGEMSAEELEAIRNAWRRRDAALEASSRRRAQRARQVAREAARLLKEEFGAERVWLFGSLARGTFGSRSDIDLAVEGISERDLFRAVGRLLALSPGIPVDLVDLHATRASIRRSIETEGVPL